MAIQNILSGGFYGKLGEVVGQRWKNKRTLRSYVIPYDPKTPEQVENRNQFKVAVELAQEAMAVNKGSSAWKSPKTPEFSLRVKTAKLRLKNGATPEEALPLFPDGDFDPLEITLQNFEILTETNELKFEIQNYTLNGPSRLKMSFVAMNVTTLLFELVNFEFDKNQNPTQEITVSFDWKYIFVSNSYFIGSSIVPRFGGKQPIILYPTPIQETTPATRKTNLSVTEYTLQPEALTLFMKSENDIFFDFDKKTNIEYKMFNTTTSSIVTKNNGELKYIGFNTFILTLPSHSNCIFSQGSETVYNEFVTNLDLVNISVVLPVIELEYSEYILYISISNIERYWENYNLRFNYSGNNTGKSFPFIYKAYVLNIYTQLYETIQLEGEISEIGSGQENLALDWKYLFDDNSYISGYGTSPTIPKETNFLLPMTQFTEEKPFEIEAVLNYSTISESSGKFEVSYTLDKPSFGWIKYWVGLTYYLWSTSQNELIKFQTGEMRTNASTTFVFEGIIPDGYTLTNGAGVKGQHIGFYEKEIAYTIRISEKTFD